MNQNEYKTKKELGIKDNKNIVINSVDMLKIDNFRHFKNKSLSLGKSMTVIFGENGTSKTTLMSLIAHPFVSNYKNVVGTKMETKLGEMFKLSPKFDHNYLYHLYLNVNDNQKLDMPVQIRLRENSNRFRIIPAGSSKGDGFLSLPTVSSSLSRLYPLARIQTKENNETKAINYTSSEQETISKFYKKMLVNDNFSTIEPIEPSTIHHTRNDQKYSIGPTKTYYDQKSISSGEDNLGNIMNTIISFERIKNNNNGTLTGIWAIDEFDASLHPFVQLKLFNYLLKWSKKNKVQIILTTHSLYLLQNILSLNKELDNGNIVVNEIGNLRNGSESLDIIKNPSYSSAYEQLTLKDEEKEFDYSIIDSIPINILCEDDVAEKFLKKIFNRKKDNRDILSKVNFQFNMTEDSNKNTSYISLKKLAKDFTQVIKDANGIIIADPDVDKDNKISFDRYFVIPSMHNAPIEAELFGWILSLDNDNSFFTEKINKPKRIIINNALNISENLPLSTDEFDKQIESLKDSNQKKVIKPFKKWYRSLDANVQSKIIVNYIKDEANYSKFMQFREEIISCIKRIYSENGLEL